MMSHMFASGIIVIFNSRGKGGNKQTKTIKREAARQFAEARIRAPGHLPLFNFKNCTMKHARKNTLPFPITRPHLSAGIV